MIISSQISRGYIQLPLNATVLLKYDNVRVPYAVVSVWYSNVANCLFGQALH